MTTYRLLVLLPDGWSVETVDQTALEFLFKSHAVFVAKLLRESDYEKYNGREFKTVDSHGNADPV